MDECEKPMSKCRRAHRSKSFIESKLKTQVESQDDVIEYSVKNKMGFSLGGLLSETIVSRVISFSKVLSL